MIVGSTTEGPVIFAISFLNRKVVDACNSTLHQTGFIKFPVFVAEGSKPESRFVVPFVGETNSNSVIVSDPELFDEAVIEFFAPLALQERDDFFTPSHELAPVAPLAVKRVGKRNTFRVAAITSVLDRKSVV